MTDEEMLEDCRRQYKMLSERCQVIEDQSVDSRRRYWDHQRALCTELEREIKNAQKAMQRHKHSVVEQAQAYGRVLAAKNIRRWLNKNWI